MVRGAFPYTLAHNKEGCAETITEINIFSASWSRCRRGTNMFIGGRFWGQSTSVFVLSWNNGLTRTMRIS